jgi:hypothetical protein
VSRSIKFLFVALLAITILSIGVYFRKFAGSFSGTASDWGDFGSYLSGTAGLLITISGTILLYSTLIQQIEYSKKQDKISLQQQLDLANQQFESNFFRLLENQRDIYKSVDGISRFAKTKKELEEAIKQNCLSSLSKDGIDYNFKSDDKKILLWLVNEIYGKIFINNSIYLSHYLRHLHTVISYVSESNVSNKKLYYNMIHSQMSDDELYIVFYNSIETNNAEFCFILDECNFFSEILTSGRVFETHGNVFFPKTFPEIDSFEDFRKPFEERYFG